MGKFDVDFQQPDRNGGVAGTFEADSEAEALAKARDLWDIPEGSALFPYWTVTAQ